MRESDRVGWAYEVHSPETKNPIEPLALNDLYNRTMIGINEHHQLHFGRELNERAFDLGDGWQAAGVRYGLARGSRGGPFRPVLLRERSPTARSPPRSSDAR